MIVKLFESALSVLVVGLIFGAGLPALFAVGIRLVSSDSEVPVSKLRKTFGVLLFALVGVTVFIGLLVIILSGFGMKLSL